MKKVLVALGFAFSCVGAMFAQTEPTAVNASLPATKPAVSNTPTRHYDPIPTARGLVAFNGSLGYAYLSLNMPSAGRVNLSGIDATLTAEISPRLGAMADFSYVRSRNVFNSGNHTDVLSYLAGPVFYTTKQAKVTTYVRGLIGGTRVHGVVPLASGADAFGYANKISYALGAGTEYRISPSVAVRAGGDFLRTSFFNSTGRIRRQNNVRVMVSVVYLLGARPHGRR